MYAVALPSPIYHFVNGERTICGMPLHNFVFEHDGSLVPLTLVKDVPPKFALCARCQEAAKVGETKAIPR